MVNYLERAPHGGMQVSEQGKYLMHDKVDKANYKRFVEVVRNLESCEQAGYQKCMAQLEAAASVYVSGAHGDE